jgi:hypothetical protein
MRPSPGILIIRLSSLGDILHTLPAFPGLTAAYRDSAWMGLSGKMQVPRFRDSGRRHNSCSDTSRCCDSLPTETHGAVSGA